MILLPIFLLIFSFTKILLIYASTSTSTLPVARRRGIVIPTSVVIKTTSNPRIATTIDINTSVNDTNTESSSSADIIESTDKSSKESLSDIESTITTITTANTESNAIIITTTDTPTSTLPTRWSPHLRFGANSAGRSEQQHDKTEINRRMLIFLLAYSFIGFILF